MRSIAAMSILFVLTVSLGEAQPAGSDLRAQRVARIVPPCAVAEYRFEDLNRDRLHDLLVVGRRGEVLTWSGEKAKGINDTVAGEPWTLPFPKNSLLSLATVLEDGHVAFVALTPKGLYLHPIHANAAIDANGILINRRMKFLLRLGEPEFSNFMQDINQDGQVDVLIPTNNHCEIWINQGIPAQDTSTQVKIPAFSRMGRFPVRTSHGRLTDMRDTPGKLSERITIPGLVLKDVNGDATLDLVVKQDSSVEYYLLNGQDEIPDEPDVVLDLSLFKDSTPGMEGIPFGETLIVESGPRLTESDLNNDGVLDYVISHGRKLWFFHASDRGPQFSDPSAIIKIAEDITFFLMCYLDEDDYPDLLMLKVKVPTLARLLQAIFADWEIRTESIGYQSKEGLRFELSSTWQGDVFLRLPSILSLMNNPDIVTDLDVQEEYGRPLHGDYDGDGLLDAAMVKKATGHYEFWFGRNDAPEARPGADDPKALGAKLRKLLFAQEDNVWDLERIKTALNGLMNEQVFVVTGGRDSDYQLTAFEGRQGVWAVPVDADDDQRDELLFISTDLEESHRRVFDLYKLMGP